MSAPAVSTPEPHIPPPTHPPPADGNIKSVPGEWAFDGTNGDITNFLCNATLEGQKPQCPAGAGGGPNANE